MHRQNRGTRNWTEDLSFAKQSDGEANSQRKLSVGGDDNLGHEVRVTGQRSVGVPVLVLSTLKLPHDNAFVARRRHNHVGILCVRGQKGVRTARFGKKEVRARVDIAAPCEIINATQLQCVDIEGCCDRKLTAQVLTVLILHSITAFHVRPSCRIVEASHGRKGGCWKNCNNLADQLEQHAHIHTTILCPTCYLCNR